MVAPPTSHRLLDPCGRFLPALIWHDLLDRFSGRSERARARWGALQRPPSPGKLVWIVAGTSRESVRLAVALTRAVMERRRDLSVTFTYETEHPDLLAELETGPRIACSHAPSDYAGAMHAVWRRLLPFGVILAGVVPRPNMIRLCGASRHALLVSPPGFAVGRYERIYPGHRQVYDGRHVAPAVDFGAMLLPAPSADQARLSGITAGRNAYLWHGTDEEEATRLYALFRGHLPDAVMFASGPVTSALRRHATQTVALSMSAGLPVPPDKLVLVDESSELAGLMPAMTAVHLANPDRGLAWLALASGARLTSPDDEWIDAPGARAVLEIVRGENALVDVWRPLDAEPLNREAAAAASRLAHANEQAMAERALADLVARVGSWQ